MSEQNQPYDRLLDSYYENSHEEATDSKTQRLKAVAAALSILDSHARGGTGNIHVHFYKDEVGPLADAIQEALKTEE